MKHRDIRSSIQNSQYIKEGNMVVTVKAHAVQQYR